MLGNVTFFVIYDVCSTRISKLSSYHSKINILHLSMHNINKVYDYCFNISSNTTKISSMCCSIQKENFKCYLLGKFNVYLLGLRV